MMELRDKAKALVKRMTLEEKTAQLTSIWMSIEESGDISVKSISGMQNSKGIMDPFAVMKDGIGQITRPLGSQDIDPVKGVRFLNRVQEFLVKETRLGIPALPHEECLSGLMAKGATIFPAGINNGSTWNPDLMKKIGDAIGAEVYSVGSRQGLAPVLDVCRDARWGRTEETFGEDPYLCAMMGTAWVRGLQDEKHPLLATLKHYAGHAFSEGGRNHAPVRIGRREFNDLFLYPFEMAVKTGGAGSVMPAYHDLDGEPFHQSREYLNGLLRDRWNFDGIVVSDYEGLSQLVKDHRTQPDGAHASAASIAAGMDVELPGNSLYFEGVKEAVEKGLLHMADVDEAVTRHLTEKFRLGLFDNPYADEGAICLQSDEHLELALKAAGESMVLLKNDGVLPLNGSERLALLGPLADNPMGMMGGYAFPVHLILSEQKEGSSQLRTLREALEEEYGDRLIFEEGCRVLSGRPDKPMVFPGDVVLDGSAQDDYVSYDASGIAAAVNAAEGADRIVLAVGDLAGLFLSGTVGEGSDASSLTLPGVQQQLIDAVLALGKPTVIVVYSGRPYHLGTGFEGASAVLQAWLPGQQGADATVNVLKGVTNPGGKLPVSIPRSAGAMPYFYNHKMKSAGTPIQKEFGAEYPFGHGCSYTTFELGNFEAESAEYPADGEIVLTGSVKNTGKRAGDEVVQLYVRDLYASLVRPVQELKAFRRVTLEPGETRTLRFRVPADLLSFTGPDGNRVVEAGEFDFMLGTSSRDLHGRVRVTLTGPDRILGEQWKMESLVEVL